MSVIKRVEKRIAKNLGKFVPSALRKRYGRAAGSPTRVLRKRMRVIVDGEGGERHAIVKATLGKTVRVRFEDGGVEDVHAATVRRATPAESEPQAELP